jgi:hypothetical protein
VNTDDFKTEEEFDLYIKGAWDERERIIALLEYHRDNECGFGVTHDIVELIKGETK